MKQAFLTLATLALIAVPMFGQDVGTKKTGDVVFGQQRLGETFDEWLAVFHLDVDAACVAKTPEAVKFLAEIEDPTARGPSLCRALVDIQSRPNDDWMFNTANNITWRVSNGIPTPWETRSMPTIGRRCAAFWLHEITSSSRAGKARRTRSDR
jgi:hypothetical protein